MFTSDVILPDTVPLVELRPDNGGLRVGDRSGSLLSPIAILELRSPIAASTWIVPGLPIDLVDAHKMIYIML